MPKRKESTVQVTEKLPRVRSPEAREKQMIALAYDLVEQRLRDGTATSQETTHFLKLGSVKERREAKREEMEIELLKAKIESLESAKRIEALYENAISAVQSYRSPATEGIMVVDDDQDL